MKKNTVAGITKVSGKENFYVKLGSRLILTPLIQYKPWNRAVNRAIDNEDVDGLMDMHQVLLRKANDMGALSTFALGYLGANEVYTDLE